MVSSDLHLLAPAAVQILYLIQIKNNELLWDTFFPQGCPMEENEILFEPNKKITADHGGFLTTRCHTGKEEILFESNKKITTHHGGFLTTRCHTEKEEILFGSNKINLLAARSRETV